MSSKSQGFTLIEVLIAMTIFAVAATGIYNVTQQTTFNAIKLEEKTIAQWVAANKLVELRAAGTWPPTGRGSDTVEMANRKWRIDTEVTKKTKEMREVVIAVSLAAEDFREEGKQVMVLKSFFGEF